MNTTIFVHAESAPVSVKTLSDGHPYIDVEGSPGQGSISLFVSASKLAQIRDTINAFLDDSAAAAAAALENEEVLTKAAGAGV